MAEDAFALFVGVDWGSAAHQVCILNAAGEPVEELSVAHTGAAIERLCEQLRALAPPGTIALAIESPASPVTEPLLAAGFAVFSLNPKQLDRFRDRFFPSGAKDDRRDSFVLATSLRTDPRCFRRLAPADPALAELRALTRLDDRLKRDRTAYANRLRELLLPVLPQLLALAPAVDEAWVWELLELAPTPDRAARLSLSRLAALLRRHRIRRITPAELAATLRQPPLPLPQTSRERCARQVRLLLPVLRSLDAQQRTTHAALQQLLEELAAEPDRRQHRDVAILLSLPGVGTTVATTMLAEAYQALADRDYHALRAHAGVAPVTRQSGKTSHALMRRGCNHALRQAVYHWSRISTIHDPRAREHYARARRAGHTHGRALRAVADRQLKLLCAMLRHQTLYDPARRAVPSAPDPSA